MITSPLRYPGGKAKLYGYFAALISQNKLFEMEYCEPYAGGAGLAIKLLTTGYVSRVRLNDLDDAIFAFWNCALNRTTEFCDLIENTSIDIQEWHKQRDIWKNREGLDELSLGFCTYFLNRTNRSGIIDGAGPIGGYAQSGEWKVGVRLVKDRQIANIQALARYAPQIDLHNEDALEFLDSVFVNERSFVYLDPPYYVKGRKLYKNYYKHNDHVKIANKLYGNRNRLWIVSYDDVANIRAIYNNFAPIIYKLQYSAGEKGVGQEVIFLSDALKPPSVEGFKVAA